MKEPKPIKLKDIIHLLPADPNSIECNEDFGFIVLSNANNVDYLYQSVFSIEEFWSDEYNHWLSNLYVVGIRDYFENDYMRIGRMCVLLIERT